MHLDGERVQGADLLGGEEAVGDTHDVIAPRAGLHVEPHLLVKPHGAGDQAAGV